MRKSLNALLAVLFSLSAQASMMRCEDDQLGQVASKNKLLKTYTREYWKIAMAESKSLPVAILKTGFVIGDFHFNNAGIYYDFARNKPQFQVIDFDDAGNNLLIVDFFKYLTYIRKLDKTVDEKLLLAAYGAGLQKQIMEPPAEIAAVLNRNQLEFSRDQRKFIEGKRQDITAFDKSSLSAANTAIIAKLRTLKLIQQLSDLDYMAQINDSGSSMNSLRVEFIGTAPSGVPGVIEFKGLKCSATGDLRQQDLMANFALVKNFFAVQEPGNPVSRQNMYRLDDNNYFLVREKLRNFLKKTDLEKLPTARLQVVAQFYANFLGRVHAPSSDNAYRDAVKLNADEIIEKAKEIGKIFKDKVKIQ